MWLKGENFWYLAACLYLCGGVWGKMRITQIYFIFIKLFLYGFLFFLILHLTFFFFIFFYLSTWFLILFFTSLCLITHILNIRTLCSFTVEDKPFCKFRWFSLLIPLLLLIWKNSVYVTENSNEISKLFAYQFY